MPGRCDHDKPLLLNGRPRMRCYGCAPKAAPSPRKAYTPHVVRVAACANPECRAEFIPLVPHAKYCGGKCRSRVGNTSPAKRAADLDLGGHRRRARKYGARYVPFKVADVLARDRWTCAICGIHTPPALRGTFEHDAPELDHALPLARGGEHSTANARCVCRSCNLTKGALTDAELFARLAA
jgi:5-methylcytosine-specific restriction endonuclease McrA